MFLSQIEQRNKHKHAKWDKSFWVTLKKTLFFVSEKPLKCIIIMFALISWETSVTSHCHYPIPSFVLLDFSGVDPSPLLTIMIFSDFLPEPKKLRMIILGKKNSLRIISHNNKRIIFKKLSANVCSDNFLKMLLLSTNPHHSEDILDKC